MRSASAVDVLTDLLRRSRARGAAFSHTTVHGAWASASRPAARISVHTIGAGEAHLWTDAPEQTLRLVPGDIVLVRESIQLQMAHAPGVDCIPFADLALDATRRRSLAAGDGPATVFFCAAYDFEGDPVPVDAGLAASDVPAAAAVGEHAAGDDGPARARDAARRARTAGAARPAARRGAGAGAARAFHGRSWVRRLGSGHPAMRTSARRGVPCTPNRRATGRWPTSRPRRPCRAQPSPGGSPNCSGSGCSPT
jgi:hypothetical protein